MSLAFHFGVLRLLTGFWRMQGFPVRVLFRNPLVMCGFRDFWGKRWNLAYSQMMARTVKKPLTPLIGEKWSMFVVFVFSGLVHELAITVPVGSGYGLPTAFFIVHGVFLGRYLSKYFIQKGWHVIGLARRENGLADGVDFLKWDGVTLDSEWADQLDRSDVLINLVGRTVNCRPTEENKQQILESRVNATKLLGEVVGKSKTPPKVWLNASTAAMYDPTREKAQTESEGGTVLEILKGLAKKFLGGSMGDGGQMVSWMDIQDFCRCVEWFIKNESASGAYPAFGWMIKLGAVFMRTNPDLILDSLWSYPERLLEEGFEFETPEFLDRSDK